MVWELFLKNLVSDNLYKSCVFICDGHHQRLCITGRVYGNGPHVLLNGIFFDVVQLANLQGIFQSRFRMRSNVPVIQFFEKKQIERIEMSRPGFVIVLDFSLDGRDEWRFKNTHPLLYQYITKHFVVVPDSPNPAYVIYKKKTPDW